MTIWIKSLQDWYPESFKMVSSFCQTNKYDCFVGYVHFLSTAILKSWLENEKQNKNGGFCTCGLKVLF